MEVACAGRIAAVADGDSGFSDNVVAGGHDPWIFLCERQQRITLGTANPAARVLAKEEHHKGENQTEADGERKRDDGHCRKGLEGSLAAGGSGDLRCFMARPRIAPAAMSKQFLRSQPVVEIAAFGSAGLDPEQVSRVL